MFPFISCDKKEQDDELVKTDYVFQKISGDNQIGYYQEELEDNIEIFYKGEDPTIEFSIIKGNGKVFRNVNSIPESGTIRTKWFLGCDSLQTLRAYLYVNNKSNLVDSLDFNATAYPQIVDWKTSCGLPFGQKDVYLSDSNNFGCATFEKILTTPNGIIYAITRDDIFISNDEAISFDVLCNFPSNENINAIEDIEVDESGFIYVATNKNGIYKSIDNGASWTNLNSGLSSLNIYRINSTRDEVYASSSFGGIYRTESTSSSWEQISFGYGDRLVEIVKTSHSIFALVGDHNHTDWELIVSKDNGETWSQVDKWNTNMDLFVSGIAIDNNRLFVGVNDSQGGSLYYTDNDGESWTKITDFKDYYNHSGPYIIIPNNNEIFLTNFGDLFKVSLDGNKEMLKKGIHRFTLSANNIIVTYADFKGIKYKSK
jgi:photosystem II stability/assembly factor-like uncharacterized protein